MPQIVTKRNTTSGIQLSQTSDVVVPGLTATLLTGSGNILVTIGAMFRNTYAGVLAIYINPRIDGVLIPDGLIVLALPENGYQHFFRTMNARPGAGAHTFDVCVSTSQPYGNIEGFSGLLTVHELGF